MRILLIPLAGGVGLGPLTRCLAVAKEAVSRGHEIVFLCKDSFADIITKYGYQYYNAPICHSNGVKPHPFRLSDVAIELGWIEKLYIEKAVKRERQIIKLFKPDVIFTETQFSVPISAGIENIPWAAATSWADHPDFKSPLYADSETFNGYENQFNRILKKYNLPKINDINELAYFRANLKIAPTIPEIQPELRQVPDVHFVGYLLSPDMEEGRLPETVEKWNKNNPTIYVYMSPGDITPEQWVSTMISAFKNTQFNIMVTLAPLHIHLNSLPKISNIQFIANLPGSAAIRRSDLVITHGGGNTVTNALLQGKPMMIFSHLYAERDYNGRAIERLGAGINFRTEQFNEKDLLNNARKIISNKSYYRNAQKLGRRLQSFGGAKKAVDLLEELI